MKILRVNVEEKVVVIHRGGYNNNYLITKSEVVTGKSQTEALPY